MSYLINSSEILQTIEMIDQQHLDVRTVTMGRPGHRRVLPADL